MAHDIVNPRMLELETAKEILGELFDIRTHEVDEMIRQRMNRVLYTAKSSVYLLPKYPNFLKSIREDKLGLDAIYIQAKRWEGTVGRPIVQAFAGSLEGQRARKGVLITTSQFSQDARDYVTRIEKKIVLIDGDELTRLMIDHGVGVAEDASYVVKRLDIDYFDEG